MERKNRREDLLVWDMRRKNLLGKLMNWIKKMFSPDLGDDGFTKRAKNQFVAVSSHRPIRVYVGDVSWENRVDLKVYIDGVSISFKDEPHEWFVRFKDIKKSDEYFRPFLLRRKTKVSFGEDDINNLISARSAQNVQ